MNQAAAHESTEAGKIKSQSGDPQPNAMWVLAAAVLVFSAVQGYELLSRRLLEIDEFLSYYTDSQRSFAKVLWVQLHYPISLDPPTYHLLSHAAMRVVGDGPIGLRLPALLGFLLFQISIFFFVRRVAGARAAVLAMVLPLLTSTRFYGVQGRPYGLLLGLNGIALACWQTSIRTSVPSRRRIAAAGLAVALVLATTSHFFGLLILIPICAGELVRTWKTRRIDWPVAAAIGVGMLSIAAVLPFQHAVSIYRAHYYSTAVTWHIIPQAYTALIYPHHTLPLRGQHIFLVGFGLGAFLLAASFLWRLCVAHGPLMPAWELVALAAITLLPVFGFLLGHFVAHTADVRYMLPALFGIVVLAGIVLEPLVKRGPVFCILLAGLICAVLYQGRRDLAGPEAARQGLPAHFQLQPEVRAALQRDPTRRVYMQSLGDFYFITYYEPDPALRDRFSLVYAQEKEIAWLGHDTNYITAVNMQHFTSLSMRPYEEVLSARDPLVLNYIDGWDWMGHDLAAQGVPATPVGTMLGGQLVELRIHESR